MAEWTSALRVLIVDDEPLIRWATTETLTAAGHVPLGAGTAKEAMEIAGRPPRVDVILLDYTLPDCSDFALLSTLRRLVPDAAIVMTSAHADIREFASAACGLGANHVLSKPFDVGVLAPLIDHLNRRRSL